MTEKWNYHYIPMTMGKQRLMLTIVHYTCDNREWYRVYDHNFNPSQQASSQNFGFGYTFEKALDKYICSFERKIW